MSLDHVALTELWTDDAVRLGPVPPAEVGKQAIRESNERQTANKGFKVLSYVPEPTNLTFLNSGWAVEWRHFTFSFIASPGGALIQVRGTVLGVSKKMPDGCWKGFRVAGIYARVSCRTVELADTPPNKELKLTDLKSGANNPVCFSFDQF